MQQNPPNNRRTRRAVPSSDWAGVNDRRSAVHHANMAAKGKHLHALDEIEITFSVRRMHAPALRSAIVEIGDELAGRLEGQHPYARETALSDAALCIGVARRAIFAAVPAGDPNYGTR